MKHLKILLLLVGAGLIFSPFAAQAYDQSALIGDQSEEYDNAGSIKTFKVPMVFETTQKDRHILKIEIEPLEQKKKYPKRVFYLRYINGTVDGPYPPRFPRSVKYYNIRMWLLLSSGGHVAFQSFQIKKKSDGNWKVTWRYGTFRNKGYHPIVGLKKREWTVGAAELPPR